MRPITSLRPTRPGISIPTLNIFLEVFKKFYLKSNNENDAAERIEKIRQGRISISEYSTEFTLQLPELGDKVDNRWAKHHFLRGLQSKLRIAMAPQISDINDLDRLMIYLCSQSITGPIARFSNSLVRRLLKTMYLSRQR
jgi:hypothetical protein